MQINIFLNKSDLSASHLVYAQPCLPVFVWASPKNNITVISCFYSTATEKVISHLLNRDFHILECSTSAFSFILAFIVFPPPDRVYFVVKAVWSLLSLITTGNIINVTDLQNQINTHPFLKLRFLRNMHQRCCDTQEKLSLKTQRHLMNKKIHLFVWCTKCQFTPKSILSIQN